MARPIVFMRRMGVVLLGFAAAISIISQPVRAAGRYASLVVDANSGRVISETSADEQRYPASLTKMMTLYVIFDLIEQRRLSYDTRVTFSEDATRVQPTKLGVPTGGTATVLEIVKGLITKSANDAAVAVAEHIAGDEEKFAALMTQTARRIGMKSTTFRNAHGLPDNGQVTTARDMITLGLRLQDDFPRHYGHFSTREFQFRGITHRNHNTMLHNYEGMDGIKTGYISSSGFNLVANVKRGDKHVIGVVFGGPSPGSRNQTMRTLLNIALVKGSSVKTRQIAPRSRPTPAPAVAARPAPRPEPIAASVSVEPAGAEPAVSVARVRPVLVAPRAQRPVAEAAMTRPIDVEPPPMAAALSPTRTPVSEPLGVPTTGAPPSTLAAQSANLARGRDPHAGAERIAQAAIAAPARLNGPTAIASAPQAVSGGVQLQVGAYATASDAERQLASVKAAAADLIGSVQGMAIAAQANGKTVHRARFVGLDPTTAGRICNDLRRRQIDCLVVRAD